MTAAACRIRVLPSQLADQIAAGEVVERPASVVKELVENALDASATRVFVEIEGGGRKLIRVIDDGTGMTPEEARLALCRHATSKLGCVEDLFRLVTMGFRGEALPSIAGVSRFTLTTRTTGSDSAFRLEVHGGHATASGEAGAPVGTHVEVRDVLYNVPARLKFLKGDATETGHVTDAMLRLALVHPDVHFRLRSGGRALLELPPHATLEERVMAALGRRSGVKLYAHAHREAGVEVTAFLAPPEEALASARGLWLYAGARYVKDRGLLQAVRMGYGELLPPGRYPQALVVVRCPEGTVDVNVHPQKTEVRFARAQEVFGAVRHAVAQAAARAPWLSDAAGERPSPVRLEGPGMSETASRFADVQEQRFLMGWRPLAASASRIARAPEHPPAAGNPEAADDYFARLVFRGQLDRSYLLCEGHGELVLVDQHAAHERIAFERLRTLHGRGTPHTQRLLIPRMLTLDPAHAAAAEEASAELGQVGFELAPFGGDEWALRAAPADLREAEVEPTLRELLEALASDEQSRAFESRLEHVLATVACHSVVRFGDVLGEEQARALLDAMDATPFRMHCPHGRPVLLRIGIAEIARRFGRT